MKIPEKFGCSRKAPSVLEKKSVEVVRRKTSRKIQGATDEGQPFLHCAGEQASIG